ncbi:hypothetical protein K1T71_005464 [Dendrolimus kikuchii]|uniref:Uncharacterized protein n=1 Tax=Dendrolimus kikuchii TaxID=765133 RepID=A0ACC1D4N6_9NEOP|nr:hypothetical protein K1T71_005464 [Dendrolimus kikuchii]
MSYYGINEWDNPKSAFNPYTLNTGNVVAIAGEYFAIVGADTRLSADFSIFTREQKKLFQLSDQSVLGLTGFWGDALALNQVVKGRMQIYKYDNERTISTPSLAHMLTTILYYKRFFPYFVLPILAGLDESGRGCIFSYDVVGHCERTMFKASGTAGALIQPILDNQIGFNNMTCAVENSIDLDKATAILKDVFISAAERDVYTGDNIQILTITRSGIFEESFALRKD